MRVDLASGVVTRITPTTLGLNDPQGVTLEPSGTRALVAERGASRLIRVNLGTGGVAVVLPDFQYGPRAVRMESGGTTALVTSGRLLVRVDLARGTRTTTATSFGGYYLSGSSGGSYDVAIRAGGKYAIALDAAAGRLVRVDIDDPVRVLAPSAQSADKFWNPPGVAVEPGGTSALVADCGSRGCCSCGPGAPTGRLVRVDLANGTVAPITTGTAWENPHRPILEAGGATALVFDREPYTGTGRIIRVTLATGETTDLAVVGGYPSAMALESPTSALVSRSGSLVRVPLGGGAQTPRTLSGFEQYCGTSLRDLQVEASGTVLLIDENCGLVARATFSTGVVTVLSSGLYAPRGLKLEAGGTSAVVADAFGRVVRVDLETGQHTLLAPALHDSPQAVDIEAGGQTALVTTGLTLSRVSLAPAFAVETVVPALYAPKMVVFEGGGGTVLVLDCDRKNHQGSGSACSQDGRLFRLNLATGVRTNIATGLNLKLEYGSLAIEGGGTTALYTDCGPDPSACAGRLMRVNLTTGARTQIVTGLQLPDGIFLEPGGATVLVVEREAGRLLRVDLGDGTYAILASGLAGARQVHLGDGGTALVARADGLWSVDLGTGASRHSVSFPVSRFAIEAGGTALLFAGGSICGPGPGALARVNLRTGALSILSPRPTTFENAHSLAIEPGGLSALLTEERPCSGAASGALLRMPLPP